MMSFEQWKEYFIANRQDNLVRFYQKYCKDATRLVETCRDLERDRRPLRIMNTIERLMSLEEDVVRIRPREGLTLFFLVVCIESIYVFSETDLKWKVTDFFTNHVAPTDQEDLIRGIQRSLSDDSIRERGRELSIETIARLISKVRNTFAHEGVYWTFHFADEDRVPTLNIIKLKEASGEDEAEHSYEVTLTLEEFKSIVIRGCIRFLGSVLCSTLQDKSTDFGGLRMHNPKG